MPRRPRNATGTLIFHVLNRAVQGLVLFGRPEDFEAFFEIVCEAALLYNVRILCYSVMPNHWHFVLWPLDVRGLSLFMKRLTGTHAQLLRKCTGTRGRGAVYQSRYKAIAVQDDRHLVLLCQYVERNARRAGLVERAEDWPWCSASPGAAGPNRPVLTPWPMPKPARWNDLLNAPESPDVLHQIRSAIRLNRHFGSEPWRCSAAGSLKWRSGERGSGRPRDLVHPGDSATRSLWA